MTNFLKHQRLQRPSKDSILTTVIGEWTLIFFVSRLQCTFGLVYQKATMFVAYMDQLNINVSQCTELNFSLHTELNIKILMIYSFGLQCLTLLETRLYLGIFLCIFKYYWRGWWLMMTNYNDDRWWLRWWWMGMNDYDGLWWWWWKKMKDIMMKDDYGWWRR